MSCKNQDCRSPEAMGGGKQLWQTFMMAVRCRYIRHSFAVDFKNRGFALVCGFQRRGAVQCSAALATRLEGERTILLESLATHHL